MKNKKINLLIDIYLNYAISIDFIIVCFIFITNKYFPVFPFRFIDKEQVLGYQSSLIGTAVSLAGFILAALTIIVTFKSSIKAKGYDDADDALEFFFSTDHYRSIVNVFKKSIAELVIIFLSLYFSWLTTENLSISTLNNIVISATLTMTLSVGRALLILYDILSLQFLKKK
jgi:hypothetical protein